MKTLKALIQDNEDWLVDRVVYYAVAHGFAEYTSTLREAWRASICGLSGPILDAIAAADSLSNEAAGFGKARESIVAFGVEQAKNHRARGVKLTDFLGLMKYYRRAYLDLIDERPLALDDARRLRGYLLEFFDQVEIGLCATWHSTTDAERLNDLQQKNKSLVNEKNKYLTIFESIREPVILLDAGNRPIHLNHAALKLFCGDVAPGATYYGAQRSPLLDSQIPAILEGTVNGSYDAAIDTLSGSREFNVNFQKMLDISKKFDGSVIILNDVSEYKRALRRAEAADHAKSTFLAAMSHEIRTPIAGVLGLARLLRDSPLSETQQRHVEGILSSGELLASVVGDILDFSQAELGARAPVEDDFDLSGLIRQVLMVMERPAAEKGLRIRTEIAETLPARLRGDTPMIRQVLVNLVHNAIKFTETGDISVKVGVAGRPESGGWRVRFEVIDSGIGLPSGPTDWLFDPFTQNDQRGDGLKGGVGLGLAICRKLVGHMGGEIGCAPNPEKGSVFRFELPLNDALASLPPSETGRPIAALNVLVVDDDEVNRTVAAGFLEKLGHRSVLAESAQEALDRLEMGGIDLVLTDNRMPEITGRELVQMIRHLDDGTLARLPIIIVTASAGDFALAADRLLDPDAILEKPFDVKGLAEAVARVSHLLEPSTGTPAETGDTLLAHLANLGPERGARVIQAFIESVPKRIASMREGLAQGDSEAVSAAAHALAGASGLLGLEAISTRAREIEAAADSSGSTLRQDEIEALDLLVATTVRNLRNLRIPQGPAT